jgi:mannose-1-phosphate guanylyltransferase
VVEALDDELVDEVLVAAGYGIEQMREHFATVELPYPITIVEEFEPLGTGGAIHNCKPHINGTFVVLNGDLVSSVDVGKMLDYHRSQGGLATISLWEVEDPTRFGIADLGEDGKISRFKEKPTIEEAFSNLINAGAYVLEPEIFSRMPDGAHSIERDVYPTIAAEGKLNGFSFEGWFVDAGTPPSWIEAMKVCLSNQRWSSGAALGQSSWLGDGGKTELGATVETSAIGAETIIESGSIVRDCSILNGALIGRDCNLHGCMVGKRAVIGNGAHLDGVVVDYDAVVPENHRQSGGVWPNLEASP